MPNNLFAGKLTVAIAKQTIGFAEAGITAENTNNIYSVDGGVASYVPGRSINAITSFVADKGYLINPKVSADLNSIIFTPLFRLTFT